MLRLLAFIAVLFCPPAFSATYWLQGQFGNASGLTSGSGLASCSLPPPTSPPVQCVNPSSVKGLTGTVTVKRSGIELFINIICNNIDGGKSAIWAGERFKGTSDLSVSGLTGITGPCYVTWQAINNNPNKIPNGDFEGRLSRGGDAITHHANQEK